MLLSVCLCFFRSFGFYSGGNARGVLSHPTENHQIKSNQIKSRRVFSWSLVSIRWLGRKQAQRKNESTLRVCRRRRRRRRRRCRRHGNGQHGRSRAKKKATTAMPFNHHDAFMNRIGCSFFFLFSLESIPVARRHFHADYANEWLINLLLLLLLLSIPWPIPPVSSSIRPSSCLSFSSISSLPLPPSTSFFVFPIFSIKLPAIPCPKSVSFAFQQRFSLRCRLRCLCVLLSTWRI